jgi:hypothetical protein
MLCVWLAFSSSQLGGQLSSLLRPYSDIWNYFTRGLCVNSLSLNIIHLQTWCIDHTSLQCMKAVGAQELAARTGRCYFESQTQIYLSFNEPTNSQAHAINEQSTSPSRVCTCVNYVAYMIEFHDMCSSINHYHPSSIQNTKVRSGHQNIRTSEHQITKRTVSTAKQQMPQPVT